MAKYGWIRSNGDLGVPVFKSSNTLQSLATSNTANQYIIPNTVPIFDQIFSDCVANSTVGALMILMQLRIGSFVNLSRLFLYWNARVYSNNTNIDQGTFIHFAFTSLQTLGVCEDSLWPYSQGQQFLQPPLQAYREANSNTISSFYEITNQADQRLSDIELAVRANHPVVFGTLVAKEYEDYDGNTGKVFDPPDPNNALGGHAQTIIGVRTNASNQKEFLVRNSWGSGWGINGCAWFSSQYIADSNTDDLFVPTQMPNLLI